MSANKLTDYISLLNVADTGDKYGRVNGYQQNKGYDCYEDRVKPDSSGGTVWRESDKRNHCYAHPYAQQYYR